MSRKIKVAVVALAASLSTGAAVAAPPAAERAPDTVRSAKVAATPDFPDPGFSRLRDARAGTNNFYLYATGPGFPVKESKTAIGGYDATTPGTATMTLKPAWARDVGPDLWAPHVTSRSTGDLPTDIEYLMFFNARFKEDRKKDKHKDQHCIGVARAGSPKGQFIPRSKPLLCPPKINLKDHRQDYDEVLDPAIYREAGRTYLVYKLGDNQAGLKQVGGKNVDYGTVRYSIQARQLDLATMELADVPPITLLSEAKTQGINAEAPDLVRAGGRTHLFVSRNYWRTNDYRTESWSASSISGFASAVGRHVEGLGDSEAPGLIGPGGAEVIKVGNTLKVAFHSHITEPPADPTEPGPLQRVAYTGNLNRVGDSFSLAEPNVE